MVGPIALKIKYRTSNQIKNERERITKIGKSITLKIGKFYIDINMILDFFANSFHVENVSIARN